eukprot:GHVQ01025286.1.p1 GENE.GHVQ01025286.1~~GHVQ01025286.1.p1  ORF type:complete len:1088 (-),score=132.92 GHVQ01025286.1:148-3411(-)
MRITGETQLTGLLRICITDDGTFNNTVLVTKPCLITRELDLRPGEVLRIHWSRWRYLFGTAGLFTSSSYQLVEDVMSGTVQLQTRLLEPSFRHIAPSVYVDTPSVHRVAPLLIAKRTLNNQIAKLYASLIKLTPFRSLYHASKTTSFLSPASSGPCSSPTSCLSVPGTASRSSWTERVTLECKAEDKNLMGRAVEVRALCKCRALAILACLRPLGMASKELVLRWRRRGICGGSRQQESFKDMFKGYLLNRRWEGITGGKIDLSMLFDGLSSRRPLENDRLSQSLPRKATEVHVFVDTGPEKNHSPSNQSPGSIFARSSLGDDASAVRRQSRAGVALRTSRHCSSNPLLGLVKHVTAYSVQTTSADTPNGDLHSPPHMTQRDASAASHAVTLAPMTSPGSKCDNTTSLPPTVDPQSRTVISTHTAQHTASYHRLSHATCGPADGKYSTRQRIAHLAASVLEEIETPKGNPRMAGMCSRGRLLRMLGGMLRTYAGTSQEQRQRPAYTVEDGERRDGAARMRCGKERDGVRYGLWVDGAAGQKRTVIVQEAEPGGGRVKNHGSQAYCNARICCKLNANINLFTAVGTPGGPLDYRHYASLSEQAQNNDQLKNSNELDVQREVHQASRKPTISFVAQGGLVLSSDALIALPSNVMTCFCRLVPTMRSLLAASPDRSSTKSVSDIGSDDRPISSSVSHDTSTSTWSIADVRPPATGGVFSFVPSDIDVVGDEEKTSTTSNMPPSVHHDCGTSGHLSMDPSARHCTGACAVVPVTAGPGLRASSTSPQTAEHSPVGGRNCAVEVQHDRCQDRVSDGLSASAGWFGFSDRVRRGICGDIEDFSSEDWVRSDGNTEGTRENVYCGGMRYSSDGFERLDGFLRLLLQIVLPVSGRGIRSKPHRPESNRGTATALEEPQRTVSTTTNSAAVATGSVTSPHTKLAFRLCDGKRPVSGRGRSGSGLLIRLYRRLVECDLSLFLESNVGHADRGSGTQSPAVLARGDCQGTKTASVSEGSATAREVGVRKRELWGGESSCGSSLSRWSWLVCGGVGLRIKPVCHVQIAVPLLHYVRGIRRGFWEGDFPVRLHAMWLWKV